MIQKHFDARPSAPRGGGPDDDIAGALEIYADDAVVECGRGQLLGAAGLARPVGRAVRPSRAGRGRPAA
jgi:hypothetical protein